KLVEKHGKKGHLDLAAPGPCRRARRRYRRHGAVRCCAFARGLGKAKGTPRQIFAASGLTTLPLALLTNRPDIRSLSDFRPADRIAVPSPSAPQLYKPEKVFGQYDKLRRQIVVLPHAEAVEDLVGAKNSVASSAPYAEIALADSQVHKILS